MVNLVEVENKCGRWMRNLRSPNRRPYQAWLDEDKDDIILFICDLSGTKSKALKSGLMRVDFGM